MAREVLLDALAAMGPDIETAVVVGAQAVYIRSGEGDVRVPPMTTDADMLLRPRLLSDSPTLDARFADANFTVQRSEPGRWTGRGGVTVDLMVCPHDSGRKGRQAIHGRSVRIPPHGNATARPARGLEPAAVDHEAMEIASLRPSSTRCLNAPVAGPAALIIAKLIKISERDATGSGERVRPKDALDIFRLMFAHDLDQLLTGLLRHQDEAHAAVVSDEALSWWRSHTALVTDLALTAAQQDAEVLAATLDEDVGVIVGADVAA